MGAGTVDDDEIFLVYEFMNGGSLDTKLWLHGGSGSDDGLSKWIQRMQVLLDVAEGLSFLHMMHKSIHRDVKSPNVLLSVIKHTDDEDGGFKRDKILRYRAKLGDFGTARIVKHGKHADSHLDQLGRM